jgi:hypothetical protein
MYWGVLQVFDRVQAVLFASQGRKAL